MPCLGNDEMVETLRQPRSDIPAVTHIDYSARVQTVHEETNPEFYRLLRAFKERTGFGLLVNTSFNVRGEPIVCSPKNAYRCFMRTEIDLLVLEEVLLWKTNQPPFNDADEQVSAIKAAGRTCSEAEVRCFYEVAVRMAARLRARGRQLLLTNPDTASESYWIPRTRECSRPANFEELGINAVDELESRLHTLWAENDLIELCELVPGLTELARKLGRAEQQDPYVSGLVYTMF